MLKIEKVGDLYNETIVMKYMLEIHWPRQPTSFGIFISQGNTPKSRLVIGIDKTSHRLIGIDLPAPGRVTRLAANPPSISEMDIPQKTGTPIFHVEPLWLERDGPTYIRPCEPFTVSVGENRLYISFSDDETISTGIRNGRVSFGIDLENYLRLVEIDNLSKKEMRKFHLFLKAGDFEVVSST